jgi:hypothetical protein
MDLITVGGNYTYIPTTGGISEDWNRIERRRIVVELYDPIENCSPLTILYLLWYGYSDKPQWEFR